MLSFNCSLPLRAPLLAPLLRFHSIVLTPPRCAHAPGLPLPLPCSASVRARSATLYPRKMSEGSLSSCARCSSMYLSRSWKYLSRSWSTPITRKFETTLFVPICQRGCCCSDPHFRHPAQNQFITAFAFSYLNICSNWEDRTQQILE